MMTLHSYIPKDELKDTERFDFLTGIREKVIQMSEVHPNSESDSHFLFLIWVDPNEDAQLREKIKKNFDNSQLDRDWAFRILDHTGDGLIILSTWC